MKEQDKKWLNLLKESGDLLYKSIRETCYYATIHSLEENSQICLILFEDSSLKMVLTDYYKLPNEVLKRQAIPVFWIDGNKYVDPEKLNPFDFENEFNDCYENEDCLQNIRECMSEYKVDALSAVKKLDLVSNLFNFAQERVIDDLVGDLYLQTLVNWYKHHNSKVLTKPLISF